jgi:hypothetical protein
VTAPWQQSFVDYLVNAECTEGGWGYRPAAPPAAEPTALTCLALAAQCPESDPGAPGLRGLASLARSQHADGGVPVSAKMSGPCWPTALAVVAWIRTSGLLAGSYSDHVDRGVEWLLKTKGRRISPRPDIFGHNPTLVGWSWVEGTYSWVEPTAYAVMALRAAGNADHARVREAVELLWDRALSDGGWNYGNTRVFANQLRPFPATTGIALAALAGEPRQAGGSRIEAAIAYLRNELPRIRSPLSLAWGLIGLSVWDALPTEASGWLAECAHTVSVNTIGPHEAALMLLADALSRRAGIEPLRRRW